MRPNWQVYVARELAGRAGDTTDSHMVGALIVRQLLTLNPGLDQAMLAVPQATQEDYETKGGDETPALVTALLRMWHTLDVPTTGTKSKVEIADGLWTLARVAFLSLPPQEIEAAKDIAKRSRPLPWYGTIQRKTEGGESEAIWGAEETWEDQSAWTDEAEGALSGILGGFGAGFGSLRTELRDATPEDQRAEILGKYDALVSNLSERRRWVKRWQEWAKGQGQYPAEPDGLWGPLTETAWDWLRPTSYGRPTTLVDVRAMTYGGIEAVAVLAAAIARDKWVVANPTRLPTPPPPVPMPSTTATVTTTPTEASDEDAEDSSDTVRSTEEEIVITPDESVEEEVPVPASEAAAVTVSEPDGSMTRVTVVPVEADGASGAPKPSKRMALVPLLVGVGAIALVVGAVVLGQKKPAYYEEG